jgi:hypothetical protein
MKGRKKTPLNIDRQPKIGSTWIIQNIHTTELCKCSATTQLDKNSVKHLRKFSGEDPFFTAKIGSKSTQVTYLKFLCSKKLDTCVDTTGAWKWLDITQQEADIRKLWYSEPNLVTEFEMDHDHLPETDFKSINELL